MFKNSKVRVILYFFGAIFGLVLLPLVIYSLVANHKRKYVSF